jgi:putative transposase
MGLAFFQQKQPIRIDGTPFVMLRKVTDDLWQIEETKTKRIHEKTDDDLRSLLAQRRLEFVGDESAEEKRRGLKIGKVYRHTPASLMDDAKVRRQYVLAAVSVPSTKKDLIEVSKKVWSSLRRPSRAPHWTSVYRWRRSYVASGKDIQGVVAQQHNRGNRESRYPVDVIAKVERAIETVYLTRERKTIQDTLDSALVAVKIENKLRPNDTQLPLPSRRLVRGLIEKIPAFDRCAARYGRVAAMRRFRSVQGHRVTKAPLERCEVDHTWLDLMVIDDEKCLPLGRPLLTACIDDYTRSALGISISFEPPSYLSVSRCLKDAFMPKVELRKLYKEIVNAWEAHGVPSELSVDNGLEFHSNGLEAACLSLGIELHYAPRKTPWFKGKVERFLGTMNRSIAHVAPGTTFANIFEKGDYDPVKHAVVRLSTLQQIARKWIVDVYHQRPHRALGLPPAVMWKTNIRPEDIPLPEDLSRLEAMLGRREKRVLTHKGVQNEGLFYNSLELRDLRNLLGERIDVEICIDDGDLGSVVVLSPKDERMFKVPALRRDYAEGLTAWQHKVCKRYADRELSKYDADGWREAKERISELIREEFALAKGKSRSRAARFSQGKSSAHGTRAGAGSGGGSPSRPATGPAATPALTESPPPIPSQLLSTPFAPVLRNR